MFDIFKNDSRGCGMGRISVRSVPRALSIGCLLFAGAALGATSDASVAQIPINGDPAGAYQDYPVPLAVGADGSYYALLADHIDRINRDGSAQTLHTFSASTVDPVTGLGINTDGWGVTQFSMAPDGNLYGGTFAGGAYGFGTLFKLTPSGIFTVLHSFDNRSQASTTSNNTIGMIGPVLGPDAALYGLTWVNGQAPLLFRMTEDGIFTGLCTASLPFPKEYWYNEYVHLVAAKDGKLYGQNTDVIGNPSSFGVFSLTQGCSYTQIVADSSAVNKSIVAGDDGNLYVAAAQTAVVGGEIRRIAPNGAITVLHEFSSYQYRRWKPPYWSCNIFEGICSWNPGHWTTASYANTVEGGSPLSLVRTSDGVLYGSDQTGGLNLVGALFRITPDGTFTTLYELPALIDSAIYSSTLSMALDTDNNPIFANAPSFALYKVSIGTGSTATASFSPSTVRLGQATTFAWSSTGAQSCSIEGDLPWLNGKGATSGSRVVRLYSKGGRTPAIFSVGIRCIAADGSQVTSAASFAIQ